MVKRSYHGEAVLPRKVLVVSVLVALTSAGCSLSNSNSGPSPQPSPSPALVLASDSKAADLRTRLDLLLGEHVFLIAKESAAAAGTRTDEYTAYTSLLTTNGSDLTNLMSSAFGDTAGAQFDQIWSASNGFFVDYTVGLVTHNPDKANGAISNLTKTFVPQFAQFIATQSQLPLDPITQLSTEQVLESKALIDDQAAQSYAKAYIDLLAAYAQTSRIGDAIATRIAQKFPDKFPGDAGGKAAGLRVALNEMLQEHAYLATMVTGAAVAGRAAEQTAAVKALAGNEDALGTSFSSLFGSAGGTQFDRLWSAKDAALVAYATATDASGRQGALSALVDTYVSQFAGLVNDATGVTDTTVTAATRTQVQATVAVIDDQRSKAFAQMAPDDRTAAEAMQALADRVTDVVVAKLPAFRS